MSSRGTTHEVFRTSAEGLLYTAPPLIANQLTPVLSKDEEGSKGLRILPVVVVEGGGGQLPS